MDITEEKWEICMNGIENADLKAFSRIYRRFHGEIQLYPVFLIDIYGNF